MARTTLRATAYTVILSAWSFGTAQAQNQSPPPCRPMPVLLMQLTPAPASEEEAAETTGRATSNTVAEPGRTIPIPATGDSSGVTPAGLPEPHQQASLHGYYVHAGVEVHHPGPVAAPLYSSPYAPNIDPVGYPFNNAPLYPSPRQDVPYQTGGALITNQAFDPHEYLYPHTYRSMYPPYYFEVVGGWKMFPTGVLQGEHWRLRGTVVTVKYHSAYKLWSGYCPPGLQTKHTAWYH